MKKAVLNGRIPIFILLITVTLFSGAYSADFSVNQLSLSKISVTANFYPDDFEFNKTLNYDVVNLKHNGNYLTDLGKPWVPVKEIKIALPQDMRATLITGINVELEILKSDFNLIPSQKPLKLDIDRETVEFIRPDQAIYESDAAYPQNAVQLVSQSDLAGQPMAVVSICPVQYLPLEKELKIISSITFSIEGTDDYVCGDYLPSNISEKTREYYDLHTRQLVINPNDVKLSTRLVGLDKSAAALPAGQYDHVIITSTANAAYYQPLVTWHTRKGVRDTVVTTTAIYADYTGVDNQEKIRNFVIDAHNTWGTMYFLIGGEDGTVPFEFRTYDSESIPSDAYYGDYDDDWDYEVFVGRVTAEGSTQINTFIDKILFYETTPPLTGFALDAALAGMDLTLASEAPYYTLTAAEDLKEYIADYYIPARFNITKIYDSDGTNHRTDFINAINSGQNLLNHADHSNNTVMGIGYLNHNQLIYNSDVDNLTNNDLPCVIFSLGCHANEMDYNDCIAEHFVIYNSMQGAVAFTGNTRSGWFYIGDPLSLTSQLDIYWWRAILEQNLYRLGEALAWTKNNNPSNTDWRYSQWTLNLLGDPEMPVWTDNPQVFSVSHPAGVTVGSEVPFTVHVEDNGGNDLSQAFVCLWKGNEVYETQYTGIDGDAVFSISPVSNGDMYVTVTRQNYVPYQATVAVTSNIDTDNDGFNDAEDNCPQTYNPGQEDADGDNIGDVCDNCPTTANLTQANYDNDNYGDACDNCPSVDNSDQVNSDSDSFGDACDNCPTIENQSQSDLDFDGFGDVCDNCPGTINTDQLNSDGDSYGDACDNCPTAENPDQTNSDGDSYGDACDNCLAVDNLDQANSDSDSYGDACDNCPTVDNPDQVNSDGDNLGDVCDNCPELNNPLQEDNDSDGFGNVCDNCPETANPGQEDSNNDLIGDACCCIETVGNINCSESETPDISDITRLIDHLYVSHDPLCCPAEADCDGNSLPEPDIADI
ncbi:MAG: C25 family cysteine peptidase, partial [Candidatus Zixiibacteriota bacterium]